MIRALHFMGLGLLAGTAIWHATPALPHSWYDGDCCSQRDCAPVVLSPRIIDVGPAGVRVRIEPGDHPVVPQGFGERLLGWDDPDLRRSQDGEWHVCLGVVPVAELGGAHRVLCVYMPDPGV